MFPLHGVTGQAQVRVLEKGGEAMKDPASSWVKCGHQLWSQRAAMRMEAPWEGLVMLVQGPSCPIRSDTHLLSRHLQLQPTKNLKSH